MKISDIIDNAIKRFPNGYVFTYTDFDIVKLILIIYLCYIAHMNMYVL